MQGKRILGLALAALLTSPAALALSDTGNTVFSGTTVVPEEEVLPEEGVVKVTVPDCTGVLQLNPYGLTVDVDGQSSTEQVASPVYTLTNESTVPVEVTVSAIGAAAPSGEVAFARGVPEGAVSGKTAFLYLELLPLDGASAWIGGYQAAATQAVITEEGSSATLTLPVGCNASFHVFGSLYQGEWDVWNGEDGVGVSLAFSFAPLAEE